MPEANFAIVHIEVSGNLPICGHDTIGICIALIKLGIVQPKVPMTQIKLDTLQAWL